MIDNPLADLSLSRLRERRSEKWREYEPDVLPVWVAEMDCALPPPVAAALTAAVARGDTGYPNPGRFPEVFAAFADRRYGWKLADDAPVLTQDVMHALGAAIENVTEPGDPVVINTPVYPPFFEWLNKLGRPIVSSPLASTHDGFHLDLDRLERDYAAGAKAHLLCNPHNPCGLALSRDELLAIAALAERHAVRVVVDEIHAPLTMPGVTHTAFASLDTEVSARSFTAVSASKAWNIPGLKAALLVPGPLAEKDALPEDLPMHAGLLGVIASEAAFEECDEWLDALREGISANAALLESLLAEHLPEVRYSAPRATYLAWLDLRALDLGDDPATVLRERGRVALAAGPTFGEEGRGYARFNLATSPEILGEAVRRMAVGAGRT